MPEATVCTNDSVLDHLEKNLSDAIVDTQLTKVSGQVSAIAPSHIQINGLSFFVSLGDRIEFSAATNRPTAEVLHIDDNSIKVKLFEKANDIRLGSIAVKCGPVTIRPHTNWRGRVIDAFARPVDGGAPLVEGITARLCEATPPRAMDRARAQKAVPTGVRAIDLFTPLVAGQRMGIFAGSGVGKSTLLAMMAQAGSFDTVVIALIGERGREVREFVEDALGDTASKAVVVVATGDESAMMRRLAPRTAMTIAEYFRDQGDKVLLIMDSITRYAHAARDVALAAGEPPVARGFPPSVFSDLPRLLERAGPGVEGSGSITGLFAVLVDGDDHNDPVADTIRGILDGHIVLDREIAEQGRYPPVNVLSSISRLAQYAWSEDERTLIIRLKEMVARYEDTSDLRLMTGHKPGTDPTLDQAVVLVPRIYDALCQSKPDPRDTDAFKELSKSLSPSEEPQDQ